ncbi:uncharacterized protein LOC143034589 isoform X2 [Oratosquilla oratoria]|uniref:uncharacterized protein LOC143034589 isoform X2 n=1 Tax=Oratosquilla oratoria TaxID=337810 RepID=UPI003F764FE3
MEKSRQRSSISFCLVLHVLFHLVAAVTAQAERHQVLDGAEGLWEPRFRSIIGVDDGDNKNDLEKGKKAKTMEEIGDYSKNKGIEPMEIIVNGIEGTNMTQRVSKRMAETCALRNLSADFSYLCSLKIPLGKLDALPSHADPGNFTTVLKMIGDGASSRKVTRHQISTVIPRLVSILSWVKRQKDGKGAHGPTHSLPQMLYSVKTISHPVAFPGEMVLQNTEVDERSLQSLNG